MTILPSVYWGSIEWYAHIMQRECVLDLGENYVKRSERNRTRIMTAGGTMLLSVQLEHADRPRQPIRDMRIDYSKRWQHQHWTAIVSAYRSSPYFDHYADRLEPLYRKPWRYLVDMNCELLDTVLSILHRTDRMPRLSTQYVACTESDTDLRDDRRRAVCSGILRQTALRGEPLYRRPVVMRGAGVRRDFRELPIVMRMLSPCGPT